MSNSKSKDLIEIQLDGSHTTKGLELLQGIASELRRNARILQETIDAAYTQLDQLRASNLKLVVRRVNKRGRSYKSNDKV